MPNRYANLVGANKIKDEFTKINTGFDAVQTEMDTALSQSSQALDLAEPANQIANQALTKADSIQTQLDTIVIQGDSSVEAAQARVNADASVTYTTLKDRLDTEYVEVTNKVKDMFVSVKDHGAKGDGVTDDTSAIQAAFDAAGKNEIVFPKGNYYVTAPIVFKNHIKVRFAGAVIITDANFVGDAVFHCNSADINDGDGEGYMINPSFLAVDNNTNATALVFDYCKHFKIYNLNTRGYIKGGLLEKAGYELFLFGFNIIAPTSLPTRSFPPLQAGLDIRTTDNEINGGAVVAYPVGVRTTSSNNFVNVHCWGIPSTGAAGDARVTLYPFMIVGQSNQFVNCAADTMDMLDITGNAGLNNGGIGFYEVEYDLMAAFPWKNKYVNCRIIKHNSSVNGKLIGFRMGDTNVNATVNGKNTVIVAPSFSDNSNNLKATIQFDSKAAENASSVLGYDGYGALTLTMIGKQNRVISGRYDFSKNMDVNNPLVSKEYRYITLGSVETKLFGLGQTIFFSIQSVCPSNNSFYGSEVQMTTDGTNNRTKTVYDSLIATDATLTIAKLFYFDGTTTQNIAVQLIKRADGWYIRNQYTGHNLDTVLEIIVRYA